MKLPYQTNAFEVPTPALRVQLIHPDTKTKEIVMARIDSGADICLDGHKKQLEIIEG